MTSQFSFKNYYTFLSLILLVSISLVSYVSYAHADNPNSPSIFLKIDGVYSGSKNPNHKDDFEVSSFNWEMSNKAIVMGGGGGGGKATFGDFQLTLKATKASPSFLVKSASGEHIKQATLFVEQDGVVAKWNLQDILITSYKTSGADSDESATDQLSLNFAKISMEYLDNGISSKGGWDIKSNQKWQ